MLSVVSVCLFTGFIWYRPPTKLREGNVSTGVCHSVKREGACVAHMVGKQAVRILLNAVLLDSCDDGFLILSYIFTVRSSCGKVMFSQFCPQGCEGGVHGKGGMFGEGGHA